MLTTSTNHIFDRRPEDAQRELSQRTTLRRPSGKRLVLEKLHSRNALKEIQELPGPEETLHVVCRGNFPLWSIVPTVLTMAAPAQIQALAIATLGFSKQNAGELFDLIDADQVRAVAVVCSVYFERQNPAEYLMMAEGLAARGQRIAALRSHAKVITMALTDGRRFAVESSANLRSCRNLEQFSLAHSAALHDFHAGWINDVIAAAGTRGHR